jgi:hypothetical protein
MTKIVGKGFDVANASLPTVEFHKQIQICVQLQMVRDARQTSANLQACQSQTWRNTDVLPHSSEVVRERSCSTPGLLLAIFNKVQGS